MKSKRMTHYPPLHHEPTAKNHCLIEGLKKSIGNTLREKRYEKNYSLKAVAQDTGISKSTISEIENGLRYSLDKIITLANYYGLQLDNPLSTIAAKK